MEVDISAYEEIIFDRSPMTELTSTKPMVMTPGKNKCSTGKTGNEEFMSFFADKNGCGGFKDFFTDKLNVSEKNDGEEKNNDPQPEDAQSDSNLEGIANILAEEAVAPEGDFSKYQWFFDRYGDHRTDKTKPPAVAFRLTRNMRRQMRKALPRVYGPTLSDEEWRALNPNLAEEAKSKEKEEQKVMAESSKENGEQKMQTSKGK